jgi:hypothetical protein
LNFYGFKVILAKGESYKALNEVKKWGLLLSFIKKLDCFFAKIFPSLAYGMWIFGVKK